MAGRPHVVMAVLLAAPPLAQSQVQVLPAGPNLVPFTERIEASQSDEMSMMRAWLAEHAPKG